MSAVRIMILVVCLCALAGARLHAQADPCLSYLKDAKQKTDEGRYDDAIALAHKTIDNCELSKNDHIEALKFLVLNYLSIDDLEAAEDCAAQVMKLSPNHEPDRLRDPAEVISVFRKYRPAPVFAAYIHGGANSTQTEVLQTYSVVGPNDAPGLDRYESALGWQLGAGFEYRIWKNLWLLAEGQYRSSRFSHRLDSVQGQQVDYRERLGFVDLNLGMRYYLGERRLQAFGEGGLHTGFLISSLAEISRNEERDLVNRMSQRNGNYIGYWLGAGVAFQQKGFRFRLGARYTANSANVVNPEGRFDDLGVIFKYYYLDNDFSMNHIQVRVAIAYTLRYRNLLQSKKKP